MATTKVTAAAAKITPKNQDEIIVVDSLGRTIVWRKLDLLAKARVSRACGANESLEYDLIAKAAAGVRSIDDVPMAIPVTLEMVEAAIKRLGDEGLDALDMEMRRRFEEAKLANSTEDHRKAVGEY